MMSMDRGGDNGCCQGRQNLAWPDSSSPGAPRRVVVSLFKFACQSDETSRGSFDALRFWLATIFRCFAALPES
jgi:hypothetical protein